MTSIGKINKAELLGVSSQRPNETNYGYQMRIEETMNAKEKLAQFEERQNENTIRVFELVGRYMRGNNKTEETNNEQ